MARHPKHAWREAEMLHKVNKGLENKGETKERAI